LQVQAPNYAMMVARKDFAALDATALRTTAVGFLIFVGECAVALGALLFEQQSIGGHSSRSALASESACLPPDSFRQRPGDLRHLSQTAARRVRRRIRQRRSGSRRPSCAARRSSAAKSFLATIIA